MEEQKFYYCPICGNIVEKINDSGNDMECCGRTMVQLKAGITDGNMESHVPVCCIRDKELEVIVGKMPHPMEKEHYIEWIEVITDKGIYRKRLEPQMEPKTYFKLCSGEKVQKVYAYCNRHKLWEC